MSTFVYSKKDFLKWIKINVPDEKVFVFTNSLCGSLSISKKSGIKVQHQYAGDVFNNEGVGHIAFGKTKPFGLLISDVDRLSKEGTEALNNVKK